MSLETRSLVLPGEIGYHSIYGSIQAGHNKDDNSDMDDDDTRRPLYKRSSVVSVSRSLFSEVHLFVNNYSNLMKGIFSYRIKW